ncbi:MAG: hypothetical protein Q9198_004604, partial [Flavoplaca austrocitrina]
PFHTTPIMPPQDTPFSGPSEQTPYLSALFNATCVLVKYARDSNPTNETCVQHDKPYMDISGNWFSGPGIQLQDWDPGFRICPPPTPSDKLSIWSNPTVSRTDRTVWLLGILFPSSVAIAGIGALAIFLRRRKVRGESMMPAWVLGLWMRMRERRKSGAKEGREIRMENVGANAGSSA